MKNKNYPRYHSHQSPLRRTLLLAVLTMISFGGGVALVTAKLYPEGVVMAASSLRLSCQQVTHAQLSATSYELTLTARNTSTTTYYPTDNRINNTYFDGSYSLNGGAYRSPASWSTSGSNYSVPPGGTVRFVSGPVTVSQGATYTVNWLIKDVNFQPVVQCGDSFSVPAAAPPPAPAPTPTPTPPAPTPTPSPTPAPSQPHPKHTVVQPTAQPSATATPTPTVAANPSMLQTFTARSVKGSNAVELEWHAAPEDGFDRYRLERAESGQPWKVIQEADYVSSYRDIKTGFSTTYMYRLTALAEESGQSSSLEAQVRTDDFTGNAGQGKDLTLTSADGRFAVVIGSAAVGVPANCSLDTLPDPTKLGEKWQVLTGPYSIYCVKADGSRLATFADDVRITLNLEETRISSMAKYTLVGYAANDDSLSKVAADKFVSAKGVTKLDLSARQMAYVALGMPKTVPLWVKLGIGLGVVIVAIVGGIIGTRYMRARRVQRRAEAVALDYWRQENGVHRKL